MNKNKDTKNIEEINIIEVDENTYYKIKDSTYAECPSCGHTGLKKDTHRYCWWCGFKLNWKKEKLEPLIIDLF